MRDLLIKKGPGKPKAEAQHAPPPIAAKLPQRPEAHERPPHAVEPGRGNDRPPWAGPRQGTDKGAPPNSKPSLDKAALRPRGVRDVQARFFETRAGVGAGAQTAPARALAAGTAQNPDLWRAWVERAYAAWRGGSQATQHPERASELMSTLTGQPCRVLSTRGAPDLLWQVLQSAAQAQQPLAAIRHGGDDDPDQPKRRRWHWTAITVLGSAEGERTVQVEGADAQMPAEVLAWPEFLRTFDEIVVAS